MLHIVAKLVVREPVGGEPVDDAESIAELVVEAGADDAGGQSVAHITDAFAHVIPDVGDLPGRRAPFQRDEDCGDAGASVAAQEVESRRLLERILDPLR